MKYTKRFSAAVISLSLVLMSQANLVPQIAHASSDDWIRSVSIQPTNTTDFAGQNMKTALDGIKATGANYVTLIIPYYQANRQATEMRPGWNTPTDEALVSAISYAHSIGLKVMLKPHLETDYIEWRGNIDPAPQDRAAWFASYQNMLIHYGTIGQKNGVEDYCVGTELLRMANPNFDSMNTQRWKDMIAAVRKIYSGRMTYSANWWGELDTIQFWDSLDYIGISAYYDLYHATSSAPADLRNSWNEWNTGVISPIAQKWNKNVVFTELGYRSIDEAYRNPWDWSRGGNYNATDQANSYEALITYWQSVPWMKGVALWRWEINPNAGGSGDIDYTPQNKPATEVLKKYWGGSGSTTTNPGGTGTQTGGQTSTPAPVVSDPNAKPNFGIVGSSNPASIVAGQANTLTVSVQNTGDSLNAAVVDVEIYNSTTGERVVQKYFENEAFAKGTTKSYVVNFTPPTSASYRTDVGMFTNDWSKLYSWNFNVWTMNPGSAGSTGGSGGTGTTGSGTGSTTPTNLPVSLDIWWPGDGTTVTGVQPFKAMLTNKNTSEYQMYWQVENGMLNQMGNSDADYPHKESLVRVAGWTWKGSEPYNINFVAKNTNGSTITQKSVNVKVGQ